MKKLEKTLWGLFLFGLLFKIMHWPGAGILTVFSLALVAMFYFYLGFALFNEVKLRNAYKKTSYANLPKLNLIFAIAFGISLSIITIGFLFKFMLWPGANFNLMIGLMALVICVVAYLLLNKQNKVSFAKKSFTRIIVVGIIGVSFFFIKTNSIIDFYYQERPEYAEALKKVIKHPDNIEYRKVLDDLRNSSMNQHVETYEENQLNDLLLHGQGESDISSHFSDWNIRVLNNDSIIMLRSWKQSENDLIQNDGQFFGKLIASEKYSYEIKISNHVGISGCNKPQGNYLDTDTIPFYIDSSLLKTYGDWKLNINNEVDTFLINQTNYLYKSNLKSQDENIFLTLIPSYNSGLFPITIKSGLRCGVYFTDRYYEYNYYLNEIDGNYELIIDDKSYRGLINKECNNCIEAISLKQQ